MPQVVAWVAAWTWQTWVAIAMTVYSNVDARRQKRNAERRARDSYNASLQDRLVMTNTVDGARSRVYGRVRNVDGILFKGSHGANSQFYTLVVALAGHECDAIEEVYFNDQLLALSSDGAGGWWVQTAPYLQGPITVDTQPMTHIGGNVFTATLPHSPIVGSVQSGTRSRFTSVTVVGNVVTAYAPPATTGITCRYQYVPQLPKARIWKYLGTDSQDIGSDLLQSRFPDLINTGTNDDRFAGICCLVCEFEYNEDAFPVGVPNITGVIRGAKILDTRTSITAWSQNPAMIKRDWSLYANGGACVSAELDEAAIIAAANACDVSTDFETPDGTETLPLYQCDIVCKTDANPDGWLHEIVESMAGKWGWAGGQLTLVAGVSRAPVTTITEDWVSDAEDIGIVKDAPLGEVVNVYRPSIADSAQKYVLAPTPEVRSVDYIAADGRELPREISLGGVGHNVHAQHICGVFMRDARYAMTISLPCKMNAWSLQMFDVVNVTLPYFGFSDQQFEVVGWQFSMEKGIGLTLKKIDASIFDPDAVFTLPTASTNTSLPDPFSVPAVTGLTLASGTDQLLLQADGTVVSRLLASWTPVTDAAVVSGGRIEVRYGLVEAPEAEWQTVTVPGGDSQVYITGVLDGEDYVVMARACNSLVRGDWCIPVVETIVGKTEPPAQPTGGAYSIEPFGLRYSCARNTEVDVVAYEWRLGSVWASGTVLERNGGTSYLLSVQATGTFSVMVAARDGSGNYSTELLITATIGGPVVSSLASSVSGTNLGLNWTATAVGFAIGGYEIRHGSDWASGTYLQTIQSNRYTEIVRWGGARTYWVAAVDVRGNYGAPVSLAVYINAPGAVGGQRADVVDNNALLYWTPPTTGDLPVEKYEVRKGTTWAGGTVVGSNGNSTFTAVFEQEAGQYTYWITAYDSAGNVGTPASITATINQPPDYILRNDYNSTFSGTLVNMLLEDGALLGPIDTTETWATHFTNNGWSSPDDQIAAGYPLYLEPSVTSGSYEETIDYGAVMPATVISVTLSAELLDGAVTSTCTISHKVNIGDPWTVATAGVQSVFAAGGLRYLKVHYDFACTAGANLLRVTGLNVKAANRLRTDSGTFIISTAATGVLVNFNVPFVDADTPIAQPAGTTPLVPVVDFTDVSNPTSFTVYLYDQAGAKVTGSGSWTARGY